MKTLRQSATTNGNQQGFEDHILPHIVQKQGSKQSQLPFKAAVNISQDKIKVVDKIDTIEHPVNDMIGRKRAGVAAPVAYLDCGSSKNRTINP